MCNENKPKNKVAATIRATTIIMLFVVFIHTPYSPLLGSSAFNSFVSIKHPSDPAPSLHKNIASAPMVATRPISSGSEIRLLSAILQAMKRLRCCPLPSGPKPFSAAEIANLPSGRLHYQRHPRRTEIHCWASDLK